MYARPSFARQIVQLTRKCSNIQSFACRSTAPASDGAALQDRTESEVGDAKKPQQSGPFAKNLFLGKFDNVRF